MYKNNDVYFTIKDWGYKYTLYIHICYRKYILADNLKSKEEAEQIIKELSEKPIEYL